MKVVGRQLARTIKQIPTIRSELAPLNTLVTQSVWSLSQATLLIENGRYILGEISPNTLNRKNMSILQVIKDTWGAMDFLRVERSLTVSSKITGGAPNLITADEPLLRIAIMNLIDNAIKYSFTGKTIHWELVFRGRTY
eukprot:gene36277-48848_t